ncbi:MAG: P-loop NTPase, partial [Oscillospiraceae bacterium]|nr:P-loop NTPase [Oscillospiraceae bacterium]
CPDCGKKINVFGESKLESVAKEYNLEILGRLPMDINLAAACDKGAIELYNGDWLDAASEKIEKL